MAKTCAGCGSQNDNSELYCRECGLPLQENAVQNCDDNIQQDTEPKNTNPKSKKAAVIIAAVLAAAILAGIVFGVYHRKSPEETDTSGTQSEEITDTSVSTENPEDIFDFSSEEDGTSLSSTKTQASSKSKSTSGKAKESNRLDSIISQIKAINYSFSFDASEYIIAEQNELEYLGSSIDANPYEMQDYSWYVNGKIDTGILYNKIISNDREAYINTNREIQHLASIVAGAVAANTDYLKKNYPEFNFGKSFANIDTLKVDTTDDSDIMGCYSGPDNTIYINPDTNYGDEDLRLTAGHEGFHMLLNQEFETSPVVHEGVSVDALTNINSAVSYEVFTERFADKFSYLAIGLDDPVNYTEEEIAIHMLQYSTGKSEYYFSKAHVYSRRDMLIDAFEPEFRETTEALSCYTYATVCSGYGAFEGIELNDEFESDCFEQFRLFLLKNAYARVIREYYEGAITYDAGRKQLDSIVSYFEGHIIAQTDNIQFSDAVGQLDRIYSSCK